MSKKRNYRINPETLLYEIREASLKSRFLKSAATVLASVLIALLYFWIVTDVLKADLPKTIYLKRRNADWVSKMTLMNRRLDQYKAQLEGLQMRDEDIYRNIFGMNSISEAVRGAGIAGAGKTGGDAGGSAMLRATDLRLDTLMKRAYVQSKSFDEVAALASRAGDMAACIPAILPMMPGQYRLTSPFGYRSDPITGVSKMHTGMDFASPVGHPVYVTGDGVVESVSFEFFGYGNSVVVDHGFGYKTRYAHMKTITVAEGMSLKRGDQIGESGKSGRITGPHLHYEVIYKGNFVNPNNFLDTTMSAEEYSTMVRRRADESQEFLGRSRNFSLRRRTAM